MNMFKSILCILLFIPLLQSQNKPSWIDTPAKSYPSSKYLTAVGSGDTRKGAEQTAAAALSQIFQSTISSEQTVHERYKELFSSPNESSFEGQTDISKNVTIKSDQTLFNIQYAESYTDAAGRTFVLAVLERNSTAEIYLEKIAENEKVIQRYVDHYKSAADPLTGFANINAASVVSIVNETLRQQLSIIKPGASVSSPEGMDHQKIQSMLAVAVKKLPFSIAISGDIDGRVTALLKEILNDLGFIVAENGSMSITGGVEFKEIDLKRPEKYIRWSYALSVIDASGASIISLSDNGREGHITQKEAVNRSLRTIHQQLKQKFGNEINKYFDARIKR